MNPPEHPRRIYPLSPRDLSEAALKLAVEAHPWLFRHLALRDYPRWWPFSLPQTD